MLDLLISPAMAGATTVGAQPEASLWSFAPMVALLVLFYFMLIRPQSKRAKEHKLMQQALSKGDEVVTDGGLMAKIVKVGDNAITVQLADNLEVKVRRESINSVLPKGTLKKL